MGASRAPALSGEMVCEYKLLRELGSRAVRTYVAKRPKPTAGGESLVVVERLVRGPDVPPEDAARFVRDARAVAQHQPPNVIRVCDVAVGAENVLAVSELIDGETLAELSRATEASPLPFSVKLRVLLDVLDGVTALHGLTDAKGEALAFVHGEVCPLNVVVGLDGTSRVSHVLRTPSLRGRHPAEATPYLAPELLLADKTADQRADIYGCGAMLWEALAGKPLHPKPDAGAIVVRLLGGKIERPTPPADAPWAEPLADVALRALATDPSKRFATIAAMASEVRRIVGAHVADASAVAALVGAACGAKVQTRRMALDWRYKPKAPVTSARASAPPMASPPKAAPPKTAPPKASPPNAAPPEPAPAKPGPSVAPMAPVAIARASAPPAKPPVPVAARSEAPRAMPPAHAPSAPIARPPVAPELPHAEHARMSAIPTPCVPMRVADLAVAIEVEHEEPEPATAIAIAKPFAAPVAAPIATPTSAPADSSLAPLVAAPRVAPAAAPTAARAETPLAGPAFIDTDSARIALADGDEASAPVRSRRKPIAIVAVFVAILGVGIAVGAMTSGGPATRAAPITRVEHAAETVRTGGASVEREVSRRALESAPPESAPAESAAPDVAPPESAPVAPTSDDAAPSDATPKSRSARPAAPQSKPKRARSFDPMGI